MTKRELIEYLERDPMPDDTPVLIASNRDGHSWPTLLGFQPEKVQKDAQGLLMWADEEHNSAPVFEALVFMNSFKSEGPPKSAVAHSERFMAMLNDIERRGHTLKVLCEAQKVDFKLATQLVQRITEQKSIEEAFALVCWELQKAESPERAAYSLSDLAGRY